MLQIVIANHCFGCEEAVSIYEFVRGRRPDMAIELIDFDTAEDVPANVIAVPAYLLNGEVIFMGNPRREELLERLSKIPHDVSGGRHGCFRD